MYAARTKFSQDELDFLNGLAHKIRKSSNAAHVGRKHKHASPASRENEYEFLIDTRETSTSWSPDSAESSLTTNVVLIGSSFVLVLLLIAFLYWICRVELKKKDIRLPTSGFVLTRRKFDSSAQRTPFRSVVALTPQFLKYESVPRKYKISEPKPQSEEGTMELEKFDKIHPYELPSCSWSYEPAQTEMSLKLQKREQRIQKRNLLFEKLFSAEDEFEVFVVHSQNV